MDNVINEATRLTLIEKLKNLDDSYVWEKFFSLYWSLLFNFCLRKGLSYSEAEDIVQDTVITVVSKMPDFTYDPNKGSFKGWLYKITRRKIIDFQRKIIRRNEVSSENMGDNLKPDKDFDQIWEEEWKNYIQQQAIDLTLKQVSTKQFQIYDSYVNQEIPVQEVCDFFQVSPNQVYLAKNRVGEIFKSQVQKIVSGKWQD